MFERSHARCAVVVMAALLTGACAPIITKTPVIGQQATLALLAGEWEGTYASGETGRSGTIAFRLKAGADTAEGEIIMMPSSGAETGKAEVSNIPNQAFGVHSDLLTIRFVRASGDEIEGILDPYRDPSCGCTLTTRFHGVLSKDVIQGTFTSEGSGISHLPTSGQWKVSRVRKAQ